MRRTLFETEHEAFRDTVREFIRKEITPHHQGWEDQGRVDREVWLAAGRSGLLGTDMPERYGGGGQPDYRFHAVIAEELARAGAHGPAFSLHNEIIGPYLRTLTTEDQQARWLPGFCSGQIVTAIAITEPEAGSDLQAIRTRAVRDGSDYILSGHKTLISNGILADVILVVARTGDGPRDGTIFAVESGSPGLTRKQITNKIGQRAQDTAELFFDGVRVSASDIVGGEGRAFRHLIHNLPRERLSIAVSAVAAAEQVLADTIGYCRERKAFGKAIREFQNTRFEIAELATALTAARAFTDQCVLAHTAGELDEVDAAMVKWWNTELCTTVVDRCLQLHGGYGYLTDLPVARAWADTRAQTIYGGTTQIMKEIIGSALS